MTDDVPTNPVLDIDRDDDPHMRSLDGGSVESYERVGDSAYFVWVDGERAMVAGHEIVESDESDD